MNEEVTTVELAEDDELFFDPADFADETGDGDHTELEEAAEEVSEENTAEPAETTEQTAEPAEQPEQAGEDQPELFELNYMGNVEKHTREEMIALAQMGRDRDRILQQRDAAQQFKTQHEPLISDLGRVAKLVNMEAEDLVLSIEKNILRQQGKTEAEADAITRANRTERKLEAYETREQQAQAQQNAAQERMQREFRDFVQRYPGVDAKTIPNEVWQDVRNGETLVNAYGKHEMNQLKAENQRLQQQLAARAQNIKNKQNSLGSMQSGSATPKTDTFLDELFRD